MAISTRSRTICSTSRPTYPTSVNLVASTLRKGAPASLASRREISVLPTPVGPIIKMFFGSTSSRSLSSSSSRRQRLRSAIATARLASACPTVKRSSSETISRGEKSVMDCPSVFRVAGHEQHGTPLRLARFDGTKTGLHISTDCHCVSRTWIGNNARHAAIKQPKDELADEAWPVTATDQLRLADELIDAAHSWRLVAIRMAWIRMRIIGLNIADRSAVKLDQKAFDLGFVDMALDVPKSRCR